MTARRLALDVLRAARQRHGFAADLLDAGLAGVPTPPDRRLATQLVLGVIRRAGTLDALIAPFLTRPFRDLDPAVLDLLRLGAYQLAFLSAVPPHAAVHETVELAAVTHPKVQGFVNAILRRLADTLTPDHGADPGPDRLPTDAGTYRRLARPLLPDPATNPAAYLCDGFSWPAWLADRWLARHGFDECRRLGFWFNAAPPLWLRVNQLRHTRDEYLAMLVASGITATPGDHPFAVHLPDGAAVRELPGYADGAFAVQDHTSQAVAAAVNPEPGWHILDLCSAPGGKTTHLLELMRGTGRVTACDIDPKRLATVTTLCQRLKLAGLQTAVLVDGTDAPAGPFDAAVVDVPCSNTGVLGRRPEVRWRLHPREFPHLIRLQTSLLRTAVSRVRPGGVVVYSTCSVEPDENGGVVAAVLADTPGLTLDAEATAVPGRPADGGYWARLRKARG